MHDFSVDSAPPNVWAQRFGGSHSNMIIVNSPKIWGNFQKYPVKLIKIEKFG